MSLPPIGLPPIGQPPVGQPPIGQPPVGQPPVGTTPSTPPTTTGGMLPPPSGGTTTTGGSATLAMADTFTQISGLVGSGLGGGIATLKSIGNLKLIGQGMRGTEVPTGLDGETTNIGGGIGSKVKGMGMAAKGLGSTAITGAKYGAIVGGVVSALSNGYQVLAGKKSGGDAIGTVAADTAVATLSGVGGALAGGTTALMLGSAIGGLPLTILAAGIGLAGAVGVHLLTQKTGLYDSIKNSVKGMVGAQ